MLDQKETRSLANVVSLAAIVALAQLTVACGNADEDPPPGPGDVVTWIGDGVQGHDGDGHSLLESRLNQPVELTFAPDGTAYIADWNNHNLRRVTEDETLETVVGTDFPGDWPCEVPGDAAHCAVPLDAPIAASNLQLNHPTDIAFDGEGRAYVAAWHNHKVERYLPNDAEVRIVGGQQAPGFAGDDGPASAAKFNFPDSIAIDESGALLVSDQRNNRVRRISGGNIVTVVGNAQLSDFSGESGPASECALALSPYDELGGADNPPPGGGLALDGVGNLYIADSFNHCVRRVVPGSDGLIGEGDPAEEVIETVAGTCGMAGYAGDDGPARDARLSQPHDVEIGPDGDLYIADASNHVIRRVDLKSGTIETVVGTGKPGSSEDGLPALQTQLKHPYGIAFDPDGVLHIVDRDNNRIRRLLP